MRYQKVRRIAGKVIQFSEVPLLNHIAVKSQGPLSYSGFELTESCLKGSRNLNSCVCLYQGSWLFRTRKHKNTETETSFFSKAGKVSLVFIKCLISEYSFPNSVRYVCIHFTKKYPLSMPHEVSVKIIVLVPVFQRLDNASRRKNHEPLDKYHQDLLSSPSG